MTADILLLTGGHGGFENIVNQTATFLVSQGWNIRYVQLLPSDYAWAADAVSFVCLGLNRERLDFEEARAAYGRLLSSENEKPDLIFAAGWPYLIYVAKGAASDAALPIPVVAWPHDDLRYYEEGGSGGVDMFRFADMCFAYNDLIARQVYDAHPEKIIYRIRYAYDPAAVSYSEGRNTKKLACVGRLSDKKVIPMMLYALEKTKLPWELVIVGEGEEEAALKKLAGQLNLKQRVRFCGWQKKPWETVRDCRALIVSSLYEGGPLTILEALAGGMQVISTPCGIAGDVLTDAVYGTIVPFGQPDALAKAIDRLAEQPFSGAVATACTEAVRAYLPGDAMRDFMEKSEACARCVLYPDRYLPSQKGIMKHD